MAIVDRNVLRLAVYEFLFTDTPHTVVINEALEIARRFSSYEARSLSTAFSTRSNTISKKMLIKLKKKRHPLILKIFQTIRNFWKRTANNSFKYNGRKKGGQVQW